MVSAAERAAERKALAAQTAAEKKALAEQKKAEQRALAEQKKTEQRALAEQKKADQKAAAERQQLELAYRKPGQQKTESRIVDPYHLANINGEWFLFAYDHLRNDVRTFAPSRVQSVKLTGKQFTRPEKFSLEKRLRDSFGVHSGQGEFKVVIRFDEFAADYIREKRWHASQKIKELPKGGLELHLTLSSLGEVERWVLGWGGHAKVLQPRELLTSVRRAAQAILKSTR